jgi:predicted AlkP superfamily phosphohydrolase/phosphomutase
LGLRLDSKALVIGLDGATFDIIEPLLAEGKLPNLSSLLSKGVHNKLYSTILPLSPTAWSSFATGKNAGKHGIYDFSKRIKNSYDYVPTTSGDQISRTMWDVIGEMGGRSIVVNVPLTYPPKPLSGFMISGFPTPTEKEDYTYPADLIPVLKEHFGDIHIHKPKVLYRKGREQEITDELIQISRQQTEITKFLMQSMAWNLTVSVYDATDVYGHYFWAYLDKNHPKYDPKLAGPVRQMVEDIHIELDNGIGELVEQAGEDALKLVISDHGFGPVYYGVYVNNWLLEQNYMHFKRTPKVRSKYWAYRRGFHVYNLLQLAKKLGLVKSIESAYATRSKLLSAVKMLSLTFDDVDWNKTSVYSSGNFGQLYLNLKGREPHGIVDPRDAKVLIEELSTKLRQLEDPDSRQRIFDHIYTKDEVFSGPADDSAPDVVFFDGNMMYAAHRMFELGSNKLVTLHPVYSGNHKMDGILFMSGMEVKPIDGYPQVKTNLVDLAPTILHFLGCPIPGDVDGRVLNEYFETQSDFNGRVLEFATIAPQSESSRIRTSIKGKSFVRSI